MNSYFNEFISIFENIVEISKKDDKNEKISEMFEKLKEIIEEYEATDKYEKTINKINDKIKDIMIKQKEKDFIEVYDLIMECEIENSSLILNLKDKLFYLKNEIDLIMNKVIKMFLDKNGFRYNKKELSEFKDEFDLTAKFKIVINKYSLLLEKCELMNDVIKQVTYILKEENNFNKIVNGIN